MDTPELILGANEVLVVPVAMGRHTLTLDIRPITKAESRLHEIQLVSPGRSGELLHLFNQACLDCKKHVNLLSTEKNYAQRASGRIRSGAIFERLPAFLKDKGLVNARSPIGSEDIRETFLATDQEYQDSLDRITSIEAAIEFFEIRHEAFKRAYFATYKLTDRPSGPAYSGDQDYTKGF